MAISLVACGKKKTEPQDLHHLRSNGNLKVTESQNSDYPVGMVLSTSWSYLK